MDATDKTLANTTITGGWNTLSKPAGTTGANNRLGYAGYVWSADTKVYHVRNRAYRPDLGRWTRRDPLGYVDGLNLYAYVQGNPAAAVDPMGLTGRVGGGVGVHRGHRVNQPSVPSPHTGGGGSSEDTAKLFCRDVPFIHAKHCYVQCCDSSGACTTYGLHKIGGDACMEQDYRFATGGDPADPEGKSYYEAKREGLFDCLKAAFNHNSGGKCIYDYRYNSCNSNWYAGSMWKCCVDERGREKPTSRAHDWRAKHCCRESDRLTGALAPCPFKCDFKYGPNNSQSPVGANESYCCTKKT